MNALKEKLRLFCAETYIFLKGQYYQKRYNESIEKGVLQIGRHTYGEPLIDVYKGSEARVIIGGFCSISPGVTMITGGIRPIDWVSTYSFRIQRKLKRAHKDGMPVTNGDIIIGSDVWIGTDASILSGVTIGHGAVIAARSVVSRDIPPYAVAAGAPARVVRYRFSEDILN